MIIISRKVNESIVINDNIFVTVVQIRGERARLGIEHPADVAVMRKEVRDQIRQSAQQPEHVE